MLKKIIVFLVFVLSSFSMAQDPAYNKALENTQSLLQNSNERNKAIQESADSKKAYDQLKDLAKDSKTEEEYFELISDILNNYRSAENDQALIQDVKKGLTDPEKFYQKLTPEQKRKINELSIKASPRTGANP